MKANFILEGVARRGFISCMLAVFLVTALGFPQGATGQVTSRKVFDRGVAQYKSKSYKQALKSFDTALKMDKSLEAEVLLYTGRILIQKKNWRPAMAFLIRARKLGLSGDKKRQVNVAIAYIAVYGDLKKGAYPATVRRRAKPSYGSSAAYRKPWTVYFTTSQDYVKGIAAPLTAATALKPKREDDARTNLRAGGNYRLRAGKKGTATLGYNFSQSFYSKFNEFNLQGHVLSGSYSHAANKHLNLSLNYNYGHYRLDNSNFLKSHSVTASAFYHQGGAFYVRPTYSFTRQDYDLNPTQDRNTHNVGLTQYWFTPSQKGNLSVGYSFARSDATLKRWSNNRHNVVGAARYKILPRHLISTSVSFTVQDYDGLDTLQTNTRRSDQILSFSVGDTYTLKEWVDIFLRYTRTDYNSNLKRQYFLSQVVSLGLAFKW